MLLVPGQYSFEMEKNMSRLFQGEEKDKYLNNANITIRIIPT